MEMMGLMSCWKKNEFNSDLCTEEFQAFRACLAAAEVPRRVAPLSPGGGGQRLGYRLRCWHAKGTSCPQARNQRGRLQLNMRG